MGEHLEVLHSLYGHRHRYNSLLSAVSSAASSGKRRTTTNSTIAMIKCLLRYVSLSKSSSASTSSLIRSLSFVAKKRYRMFSGTASKMASAHSRLILTTSSFDGGVRAGARALSGKMALRAACRTDGNHFALSSDPWMWNEINLQCNCQSGYSCNQWLMMCRCIIFCSQGTCLCLAKEPDCTHMRNRSHSRVVNDVDRRRAEQGSARRLAVPGFASGELANESQEQLSCGMSGGPAPNFGNRDLFAPFLRSWDPDSSCHRYVLALRFGPQSLPHRLALTMGSVACSRQGPNPQGTSAVVVLTMMKS